MIKVDVVLTPVSALQVLDGYNRSGYPWHLVSVGLYGNPSVIRLALLQDGNEEPVHIVLHPDGTWKFTTQVSVDNSAVVS